MLSDLKEGLEMAIGTEAWDEKWKEKWELC
jgi:hypothetical protein